MMIFHLFILLAWKTISGNRPNTSCAFPFKYGSNTYYECRKDKFESRCSTKVDSDGRHIDGEWGDCGKDGPVKGKIYIFI